MTRVEGTTAAGPDADEDDAGVPAATDDAEGGSSSADADDASPGSRHARRRRALLVLGLTAIVTLPLYVALAALRTPRWHPLLDLAMTEMRVRDTGTGHTPLVGLVGRLSSDGHQGSHLGPLSFWSLAPVYRVLGESAWSLLVGVVLLNTTAIALTIWAALRRGGTALAVTFAAGLAVLVHLYGTTVLTEPWNPYLPVLWWTLAVVAVWSVLCDDLAMLPVAVFAASFCLQTHVSYGVLVGGFTAAVVVFLAVRAVRLRGDRPALARLARWTGLAVGLGVLLWTAPLVEQVTNDPGNMSIVVDHFANAEDDPVGIRRGTELYAVHLNPWRLLAGQPGTRGAMLPAALLIVAWLAAAAVAWRAVPRDRAQRPALLRLHAVIALSLALGFVSSTRILGFVWFYLTLWAWTTNLLMLIAIGWTAVLAVSARRALPTAARRVGLAGAAGVLAAWTVWFAVDASDAEPSQANFSAVLADFTDATLAAVDGGDGPGGGPDGTYLVTWTDGVNLGSTGYGLVNELERAGIDAGAAPPYAPGALDHRITDPDEATGEIHISFGPDIERWDQQPEFERIALVDNRTDEEREAVDEAGAEVVAGLRAAGREDLVPLVDIAPFQLYFNPEVPDHLRPALKVINDTGQPAALYLGPPTTGVTSADG